MFMEWVARVLTSSDTPNKGRLAADAWGGVTVKRRWGWVWSDGRFDVPS